MERNYPSLSQLAALVEGTFVSGVGQEDPQRQVLGAAPLYEVRSGQITFVEGGKSHEASLEQRLVDNDVAAIVVAEPIAELPIAQIVCCNPREAFARIVQFFQPPVQPTSPGVDPRAAISETARLGTDCRCDAGVVIGNNVRIGDRVHLMPNVVVMDNCVIGDDCVLFPNVTLYERTQLGNRVTLHSGTVLGAYGFGYTQSNGQHQRTAQLGHVIIEDDVELGACVTIDRGTYGSTRIGAGTKIDNQVMVGHNCQIGRHNLLCSQVGIAGSCTTGDYVVLAGQVGLKDHITLGDGTIVGAQSGVMDNLAGGQVYLGSPATAQREQMQIMAVQRKLPELRKALKELQRKIEAVESQQATSSKQNQAA